MIVNANLTANLTVQETLNYGFSGASTVQSQTVPALAFTNGTTTGAIDLQWAKKAVVLAASASTTYTLSALTDDLARTVALVKVRALMIQVTTRTAGDYLTVGNAGTHPWTAILGGTTPTFIVWDLDIKAATLTDGFAVTSGSSDQLKILNSGSNSITFNIFIIGTSA